jgi:chromate transporter
MIPFMKVECVDHRAWMDNEQFIEALALGNALPGPIAAKMSVFVGLRVAGVLGAIVAFAAVMGPSVALMLGLAGIYYRFRDQPAVAGAMEAAKPAVVGMLFWTALVLTPDGVGSLRGALLAGLTCLALFAKVPPALVLILVMGGGALFIR